ncbi:MAG TPA: hypothetical protein VG637_00080, partial [Actinomycetes bacterium]|nr:hypothetical protein [Actinomycetes bacterium]
MGRRRADVGHAEGDQGIEEGGGDRSGQPFVQVELQAVGDGLDQALEADLDPGGQAEQEAQDPQPAADQGLDPGAAAQEQRPRDPVAPGRICEPSTGASLHPSHTAVHGLAALTP